MIPRIIHYCWFGRGLMPQSHRDCIKGWQRLMPDYTFMRWDESNFDPEQSNYTSIAYSQKKYAFVADVARLHALLKYGGVYLDTDVELYQRLDSFLNCNFFSGVEIYNDFYSEDIAGKYLNPDGTPLVSGTDVPHLEILTSTIGSCPNNDVIRQLCEHYHSIKLPSSTVELRQYVIFDRLVARVLVPYGFRYKDKTQYLDDEMIVYGTGTFGYRFSPNANYTVSYHHNATSWDRSTWTFKSRVTFLLDQMRLLKPLGKLKSIIKKV